MPTMRIDKRQTGLASVELMLVAPILLLIMIIMVNSAKTMLLYEKRVIESRNAAYLVELYEGGEPKGFDARRQAADEGIKEAEKIAVDVFNRSATLRSALDFEITQGDIITLPLGTSVMRYGMTPDDRHEFYDDMVKTTRDEMDAYSGEDDPNIMTDKIRRLSKVLTNDYSRSGATVGVSVSAFQGPLGKFQPAGGYLAMRDYHTADFSNKLDLFERDINSAEAINEGYNLKAGYSEELEKMLDGDELFEDVFADTSNEALAELGPITVPLPLPEVDTGIGIVPGGSGTCSFAGDTLVKTQDGYKEIQYITAGDDLVWARDERTGRMGWRDVLAHYSNRYQEMVHVTAVDRNGNKQTITSNRIHPYFARLAAGALIATSSAAFTPPVATEGHVYSGNIVGGAWVDAQYLKPGDQLLSENNQWQTVELVQIESIPLEAYNLTVDEYSSYFVSGDGYTAAVWVHNDCWDDKPEGYDFNGEYTQFGHPIFEDASGNKIYRGHDYRFYDIVVYPPSVDGSGIKQPPNAIQSQWDNVTNINDKSKQILDNKGSSTRLARNMEKVGVVKPSGTAAHHIVPKNPKDTNADGKRTLEILNDAGIDIDEAVNGVFLPRGANFANPPSTNHGSMHTNVYYKALRDRLEPIAGNEAAIRSELQKIAKELADGLFKVKD